MNAKMILIKRACSQLVEFTNNFHASIKQVSEVGHVESAGVFFISLIDLDTVISKFIGLTQVVDSSCENPRRLLLGYENKTFDDFIDKYGLVPISNDKKRPKSILGESLELVSSAVQLSSKGIREKYDLDVVGYRKLGIKLMHAFISEDVQTKDELISFLEDDLRFTCQNGSVNLDSKLNRLVNFLCQDSAARGNNFCASIHKAKGLEAESVLVVAKNKNELKKWLTTDYEDRYKDKNDTCRIGYVGFTRAKQILCIACKETIDNPIRTKLRELGVEIVG